MQALKPAEPAARAAATEAEAALTATDRRAPMMREREREQDHNKYLWNWKKKRWFWIWIVSKWMRACVLKYFETNTAMTEAVKYYLSAKFKIGLRPNDLKKNEE